MNHSILVTGGAGYIGSHTVLSLQAAGFNPIVVDNLTSGNRQAIPENIPFYQNDIQQTNVIRDIIKEYKIKGVIHFAGSISVPESVEKPLYYYTNNTINTHGLITLAMECELEAFLFSSTAAVYGMAEQNPITESCPLKPISPYGASKLMSEYMLRDSYIAYGMPYGILRYFNVAGADPLGRCGQSGWNSTHLIKIICEALTKKRDYVSVYGTDYDTPDGTCIRDYIHVTDLADAHVQTLRYILTNKKPLLANCGYSKGYSVREVLHAAEQVTGQKLDIRETERRAGDPSVLVADCSHIKSTLGWKPKHENLEEIILTALKWEQLLEFST